MKRLTDDELLLGDDYAMYDAGEPFTGVCYDTRPDGTLWSEETYVRGLKDGPSRTFYPDGQLQRQTHYKLAYPHGWKEEFFPDGRLRRRTLFELGIVLEEEEFDGAGQVVRRTRIEPGSAEYGRLELARQNERQRVAQIHARFGRPEDGDEGWSEP